MRRTGALLAACAVALTAAPLASASFIVARNASNVALRVRGTHAIVVYRSGGRLRHAVLWGAVDARSPGSGAPQVAFRVRYGAGGAGGGACRPYDGPPLPLLVAACTAPDGSFWALQSWQRLLRDYGGVHAPWELHASHWRGALPALQVWEDWVYGGRFQHLFGRLTYRGAGVHGFHSTSRGSPLDAYGRNLYLDVLRLPLRPRLAARQRLPRPRPRRNVLLRALPAPRPPERGRPRVPADGRRPGRDARDPLGGAGAGRLRRRARPAVERGRARARRPEVQTGMNSAGNPVGLS